MRNDFVVYLDVDDFENAVRFYGFAFGLKADEIAE
jgi:hypothetical protein